MHPQKSEGGSSEATTEQVKTNFRLLKVHVRPEISPDTFRLRNELFSGGKSGRGAYDEFDARSLHIALREGEKLAAYSRLTIGQPGVISTWTSSLGKTYKGAGVADVSRGFVVPEYRRLELFRAVLLEALVLAYRKGVSHVNGAYLSGRHPRIAQIIHDLGCVDSGSPVNAQQSQDFSAELQPVVVELEEAAVRCWPNQRKIVEGRLARAGFEFHAQPLKRF